MAASVKLDEDMKSRIQHLADVRNLSAQWIMREAIRDYVEREEAREDFKEAIIQSLEDVEAVYMVRNILYPHVVQSFG